MLAEGAAEWLCGMPCASWRGTACACGRGAACRREAALAVQALAGRLLLVLVAGVGQRRPGAAAHAGHFFTRDAWEWTIVHMHTCTCSDRCHCCLVRGCLHVHHESECVDLWTSQTGLTSSLLAEALLNACPRHLPKAPSLSTPIAAPHHLGGPVRTAYELATARHPSK